MNKEYDKKSDLVDHYTRKGEETEHLNLRVSPELKSAIKRQAMKDHRSVSNWTKLALIDKISSDRSNLDQDD